MLKVLMLGAEITPIAKVGGLGDVLGALPKALFELGLDVRLCLPFYGLIDTNKYKVRKVEKNITFMAKDKKNIFDLWETILPETKIPVYLIKHSFFDGQEIYTSNHHISDPERFSFFSQACLEAAKALNFKPHVIHANDWHVALIPQFLKTVQNKKFFRKTRTIYTIHNLASQGIVDKTVSANLDLDPENPTLQIDLENGDLNFMVEGIIGSDIVTTVSPTYAKEILTKETGAGLSKIIKLKKNRLFGIINGLDVDFFNPQNDKFISENYSSKSLDKKYANKLVLQKKLGLPIGKNIPLVGFVSRFVWQKGVDLITEDFNNLNCQFVFLGTGEKKYEAALSALQKKFPHKFSALIKFDAALAQEIYAASDIFLVPSRFEPCGLTQMIAMRYGSIPVVRKVGGLADTVDSSVGFTFKKFDSRELFKTMSKAIKAYESEKKWRLIQINAMKKDFSWKRSAKEYFKLYKYLISDNK